MNTEKKIEKIAPKEIGKSLANFWNNNFRIFFVIFFIIVLTIGGFFWYRNLYTDFWTQEQRNEYRQIKDESVTFKKNEFLRTLEFLEVREKAYKEDKFISRDVFKKY